MDTMRDYTRRFAVALDVLGLINVQFAVHDGTVYVIEVNPRASRTVPFVSKATGVPLGRIAARVLAGRKLSEFNLGEELVPNEVAVKEAVLPFDKFPGADTVLGPEMRSTGEVMGFADSFGLAFAKSQVAVYSALPTEGTIAITVHDRDKPNVVPIARRFHELGFSILATEGTARYLSARGVPCERILKVHEGRPNLLDKLLSGEVQHLVNTPLGKHAQHDDYMIRRAAVTRGVPYTTTLSAASASADAIIALRHRKHTVRSLQARGVSSGKRPADSLQPGGVAKPVS
jgi:carbamoyl-phosphate synthase large subunit